MNKIWIIIKREYFTRVRKTVFIVTTLLAPLFLGLVTFIPLLIQKGVEEERIVVLDESNLFADRLESKNNISFLPHFDATYDSAKKFYKQKDFSGILFIPASFTLENTTGIEYYSDNHLGVITEEVISSELNEILKAHRLEKANITAEMMEKINTPVKLIQSNQELGDSSSITFLGYVMGFLIYIVLLLYGTLVMRGVMEEKTSRIAEVIISSVKPFQLMMGKIIGIAFVGLTQFVVWIIGAAIIISVLSSMYAPDIETINQFSTLQQSSMQPEVPEIAGVINDLTKLPLVLIAFCFLFYFFAGYLLYASIFAAIGAAAGEEGDQSLTFIATVPIIISILIMVSVLNQPNSQLAVISSMIPFTSPVIMSGRLPFIITNDNFWIQTISSMMFLVLGFVVMTWIAARIYRVGILMYGKKVSFREMVKWVTYKN